MFHFQVKVFLLLANTNKEINVALVIPCKPGFMFMFNTDFTRQNKIQTRFILIVGKKTELPSCEAIDVKKVDIGKGRVQKLN